MNSNKLTLLFDCMVKVYLFFDFFNYFFNKNKSLNKKRIWIGISAAAIALLYIAKIWTDSYWNTLIAFLLMWTYISILFETSVSSRFIYFLLTFSIVIACELALGALLTMTVEQGVYDGGYIILLQVIIKNLLIYFILVLIKQLLSTPKNRISQKIWFMYLCIPVGSLGILFSSLYSGTHLTNSGIQIIFLIIYSLLLFVGNVFCFHVYSRYSKEVCNGIQQREVISRQKYDLLYFEQLMNIDKKREEFVHNTTHYLKVISKLAHINDCSSILKIVGEMHKDIECEEFIVYSNNHILNAVLTEKKNQAGQQDVRFDAYVEAGSDLNMIEDIDLIAMLGNLLDNAIRAAAASNSNNWVRVRIFMQNIGGFCIIKIRNGCTGQVIVNGDTYLSTKKEKGIHGLGLRSVKNMAQKYGGNLNCCLKEDVFEAILMLSTD